MINNDKSTAKFKNKKDASELYKDAYFAYEMHDYEKAKEIVLELVSNFPSSKEAKWAAINLKKLNITIECNVLTNEDIINNSSFPQEHRSAPTNVDKEHISIENKLKWTGRICLLIGLVGSIVSFFITINGYKNINIKFGFIMLGGLILELCGWAVHKFDLEKRKLKWWEIIILFPLFIILIFALGYIGRQIGILH